MDTETRIREDLARSGLVPQDITARAIQNPERAATNTGHSVEGYTIPYYDINGKLAQFYRVKLFDNDPKYKQPKETPNHVYFPKGFMQLASHRDYVIITEGEKKAAAATKMGFPTVALGGVDSWRNRLLTLPKDIEINARDTKLSARVPAGGDLIEDFTSPLARGMQDLIDYALKYKKHVIILYDTDTPTGMSYGVQRAASALGFELRFRGIPFDHIRQIVLPNTLNSVEDKVGLDEYLIDGDTDEFNQIVRRCIQKRSAFPRHPNVRDYLNKRLQKPKMSRKEMQQVALAILSELDATGMRLRSSEALQSYYFDGLTYKLIKARFKSDALTEDAFGQYLYKRFGIGAADDRVIQWLGSQFNGEDPIADVTPHRVFARIKTTDDNIIMQISDGAYVVVDKDGLRIKDNGTDGVLFESEQVKPLDKEKLIAEWERQYKEELKPWWFDVLNDVRLKDKNRQRHLTGLLFYISPWLYRWRGTQLPIEMTLGEAGSGKSTLQELRLNVQTGFPKLRNAPHDIKDWHASVANAGGLHITDNVQLVDRNMRQRLSDEICRIITEPNPNIEMRKYYTNAELMSIPVRCVFGITAIQQPFLNADILQRSFMIELDKSQDLKDGSLSYDMMWMSQQLNRYGGREAWVAHHLLVLHKFFQAVSTRWNARYQAKHRLINFEQSLMLMADIFGVESSWIPDYLMGITDRAVTDADWAFEGIIAFSQWWKMQHTPDRLGKYKQFIVQDMCNWAMGMEEYEKCEILINSRRLGRYLKQHKTLVATTTGIQEDGSQNNRQRYSIASKNTG